ncbi:MAG: YqgE/AlgH family protein [Chitinophagaceae bacterium]|nr:YqgE/AlgH family protein [Chitinophagaceae bacterium]
MTALAPGILLIAEPFLKDPNFSRTVVFICDHHDQGTLGFILNREYGHTLDELMHNIDENLRIPVFYGGPVQKDTIHFIHQYPEKIIGSYEIVNGIYWGGDFELAVELIKKGDIQLSGIRFFIGYSGWSEGQLDSELSQKTWLTADATRKLVFHKKTEELWKDAVISLGGDYSIMVNFPTDPQLN